MDYKKRIKNRKLNNIIITIFNLFRIRSLNLMMSWKIILFWVFITFVSLFLTWVQSSADGIYKNSFYDTSWNVGFIILFLLIFIIFNLFSINNKEKLKLHIWIHFKDYPVSIVLGAFIMILWIVCLNFVEALSVYSNSVIYGNGIISAITWWVIIFVWWIYQRVEFNKFSENDDYFDSYSHNEDESENDNEKNNMKLPF